MAKVLFNRGISALTGNIDRWVYKQWKGQPYVSRLPNKKDLPKRSAAQKASQKAFTIAAAYARRVLDEPLQKTMYERLARTRNLSANSLLMQNYRTKPQIELIDLERYRGKPQGLIRILAHDTIAVASVEVTLRLDAGDILEEGRAVLVHEVWVYETTAEVPAGEGAQITVTVANRPGNKVEMEKPWRPA